MKKAFSLLELIIVIVLILIISFLLITNFKISNEKKDLITIENIKEKLLKMYDFKESLELICLEKTYKCYIKKDDKFQKESIDYLFKNKSDVYSYEEEPTLMTYNDMKINDYMNQKVMFILRFKGDKKSSDFILKTNDDFYVFNSIFSKPKKYKSMKEIKEEFQRIQKKVKNAF